MNPKELIDRVASTMGLHLAALAERLGLEERTLKRVRAGEIRLSDQVRLHLLDLERIYSQDHPKNGRPALPKKASRLSEEAAEYNHAADEALRMVLSRVTAKCTVSELAALISEIANDEDLPQGLRTRVVGMLSGFIPLRMK